MAFTTFDSAKLKVGDPITKELWDLLKSNFDDHETRLNSIAATGTTVYVLNGDIDFVGFSALYPDIFYFKARQDFSINNFSAQLFSKQGLVSGNLVFVLEKSIDTNDANFSTVLTSNISFDFSVDADYSTKSSVIDPALNSLVTGNVLRIKCTGVPIGFSGKVLINIGAQ